MTLLGIGQEFLTKLLPITYAIIGFSLIIIVHEFGHFSFCKLFNIDTPTFSIGFGPEIIRKKIGKTDFRIAAIPLGGYVEISGLAEPGQGDQTLAISKNSTSFATKPYWQKCLVTLGGVSFNIIFAYIALIFLFMVGAPKTEVLIQSTAKNSIAEISGFKSGDKILKIGNYNVAEKPELLNNAIQGLQNKKGETITFIIMRNDNQKEITINMPTTEIRPKPGQGKMGFVLGYRQSEKREKFGLIESIKRGSTLATAYVVLTLKALKLSFSKRTLKGTGGPVMILSETIKQAKHGFILLLGFLAIISIGIGIFQLIPIPALDGGQLMFISIEALIGREIPLKIKETLHMISLLLILALFLYITYSDILMLIKGSAGATPPIK
ncbi:site-2 protease family protein [Candidatus Babeliales bacterium]|nr:site-2 protease family protein [Candidatus Babeliales bacterium]